MIYDHKVVQDGYTYESGEEVPDMGTITATSVQGNIRNYEGYSYDFDKLPTYDDLGTGSSVLFVDTGEYYKYEATTKMWNKL